MKRLQVDQEEADKVSIAGYAFISSLMKQERLFSLKAIPKVSRRLL